VVDYKEGDTVYYHGKRAEHMYVVLKGEVSLRLPGKGGISIPIDEAMHLVLARGLPVGGDLEYADQNTLLRALAGRQEMGS